MSFLLAAILSQAGPLVNPGAAPPLPHPPAIEGRGTAQPGESVEPNQLQACLVEAETSPADAIDIAEHWLDEAKGSERASGYRCLGAALTRLERWDEAEDAFMAAHEAMASSDLVDRARLAGMAGNAALADGSAERALSRFDAALADARAADAIRLTGEIAIDRARALVALQRDEDAAKALVEARTSTADNPLAWLLSATLSRRMGKLEAAQAQIETAAGLLPVDPEIGLEAGLIAVLSGRDEAARLSWRSVIDAAPNSQAAATARTYLEQLGPQPASQAAGTP